MKRRISGLALSVALVTAVPAQAQPPQHSHPQVAHTHDPAETARNRRVVEDFIRLFYVEKNVADAFNTYVREDYIQHNPLAPDGRDAAIRALSGFFAAVPTINYEVQRIIVDGNLAAVHVRMRMNPEDRGSAVIDILRLEDGKIVEHWDVIQAVPEQSANPHPMF